MGNKYFKTKLLFFVFLLFFNHQSYGSILLGSRNRLECYDCSEIDKTHPEKVCSKNEGRTKKAQFIIFKKELHLPSPFAKTGDLFWPDFPRFRFFVYQGGANWKDWSK